MKKSRAVIALIAVAVITGLMAYTALVGLGSGHRGSYHNIKLGLDLAGGASITYEAVGDTAPSAEDMADTVYKLQQRVDQYSTEAQVYTEGSDRINIEIPGSKRPTRSLRNWASPALCILSDRQMRAETRTMNSELTRTAITAMS